MVASFDLDRCNETMTKQKQKEAKQEGVPFEADGAGKASSAVAKKYEPTENERRAMEAHFERRRKEKPSPRLKVSKGDIGTLTLDHPDMALGSSILLEALGTADNDFGNGLLTQLANVGTKGRQPVRDLPEDVM